MEVNVGIKGPSGYSLAALIVVCLTLLLALALSR